MIGIAVVALQPFEFEGHSYVQGQQFETTPINAAAFTYQRWARYASDEDLETPGSIATKVIAAAKPQRTAPKRTRKPRAPRGTYNRRDIAPSHTK